ncbi:hypothetical protein B0I72DRAFT_129019 [Yarrowia lipolytica]|uniref:Uncharacterized protein n=1 Tax=Yarrowia lipolytica TaxID=4952 RepID=A0A371CAK3_YARLL|nr:hypothetical protein B0I71DRAFT_139290 [Yarrowia lipolytica]RDW32577.1 hypothetical protein B0I72DRAFT_129019 [Yarrowia lipolytica]RDW48552.1 hypothetical protein B0I74DRAFT_126201 [Yarrowia lipolytica]RDW53191.1 hypothetical protein B0I75DRAFT_128091 [Yarrowia lipolytica]
MIQSDYRVLIFVRYREPSEDFWACLTPLVSLNGFPALVLILTASLIEERGVDPNFSCIPGDDGVSRDDGQAQSHQTVPGRQDDHQARLVAEIFLRASVAALSFLIADLRS